MIISYGQDGEAVSVEFMHASVRRLVQMCEITGFTGVDDPYEAPGEAEIALDHGRPHA